jgi:hypothetical protein
VFFKLVVDVTGTCCSYMKFSGGHIEDLQKLTYCLRQTQQILLILSVNVTSFGSNDRPQAFRYMILKLKIKFTYIYIYIYIYYIVQRMGKLPYSQGPETTV